MFRYLLGALCALVCIPALALEVTSDFTLDFNILDTSDSVQVRGDAVLTVDVDGEGVWPRLLSDINLWDTSSLVIRDGELRADILVLGDNRIDFLGGVMMEHLVRGEGNVAIEINGWTEFAYTEFNFPGGQQSINIRDFWPGSEMTVRHGPGAFVRVFSDTPDYRVTNPGIGPDVLFLHGGYINVYAPSDWLMYTNEDLPAGDTNADRVVDVSDLNNVRNLFGSHDSAGDALPKDGMIGIEDLNAVRNTFGHSTPQAVPTLRPSGDADGDGDIDDDDLAAVRASFGEFGLADGTLRGDTIPFDGRVGIVDLNNVRNARPAPEPSSIALLAVAVYAGVSLFRSRGSARGPGHR